MSDRRPNTRSVEAMTRLNAEAGQTDEARGMSRSVIRVGNMTPKPETKNSVMICDIVIENRNAISLKSEAKAGGRARPKRSMRASSDSSSGRGCTSS